MSTDRLQTFLITGLSMGLGAMTIMVFQSQPAIGLPSSPTVSVGTNPVRAWAGTVNSNPVVLFTAPTDQDIVITDVHLSCNYTCETRIELIRSDASTVGSFWISGGYGTNYDSLSVQQQFASGIPVPAGQSLSIETTGPTVAYTISGYEARP